MGVMDMVQTLSSILVGAFSGLAGGVLGYLGARNTTRRDLIGPTLDGLDKCFQAAQNGGLDSDEVWRACLTVRGNLYALGVPVSLARAHSGVLVAYHLRYTEWRRRHSDPTTTKADWPDDLAQLSQAFHDLHVVLGDFLGRPISARSRHFLRRRRIMKVAKGQEALPLY